MNPEHEDEFRYTPIERAVAEELGIDVAYVKLILDTFEEQFDRLEKEKCN